MRKKLVYILSRRLTEKGTTHAVVHRLGCWHIDGAYLRGETTTLSRGFARSAKLPRCQDCKP